MMNPPLPLCWGAIITCLIQEAPSDVKGFLRLAQGDLSELCPLHTARTDLGNVGTSHLFLFSGINLSMQLNRNIKITFK